MRDSCSFKFYIEDITEIEIGNPASDYFSGVESVSIDQMILEEM